MIGAIAGDVIGSIYEKSSTKTTDIELFLPYSTYTDDTVMTIAVADAIINNRSYQECLREWGQRFPKAGYGGRFYGWLHSETPQPYNSWGNGSAMKASPIGFAFNTEEEVLKEANKMAEITHNHPEGIKGAQAVALSVFMAKNGVEKEEIRRSIAARFDYDLSRSLEEIRPGYSFEVSCMASVPEAIISFLDSHSLEDAIRKAISLGGDSDTQACIAGGIAQAYYKEVPDLIREEVNRRLTKEMRSVIEAFEDRYMQSFLQPG